MISSLHSLILGGWTDTEAKRLAKAIFVFKKSVEYKAFTSFLKAKNPFLTKGALLLQWRKRTLLTSNLKPLNELKTNGLKKVVSPHKIERPENETPAEILSRDLVAINEFLYYMEVEPFVSPEKAEKHKRVAFKK